MAEYIECETLISALESEFEDNENCRLFVSEIPTADVVEVRHGRWEVTEHSEHLNVICSNCNEDFYVYKKGQYRIDRSNYCPKCGARMEREGK